MHRSGSASKIRHLALRVLIALVARLGIVFTGLSILIGSNHSLNQFNNNSLWQRYQICKQQATANMWTHVIHAGELGW